MASEIELCPELWKYRIKKSLLQMVHFRCRKSRFIAIGKPHKNVIGTLNG
jgi:hypothetical protein